MSDQETVQAQLWDAYSLLEKLADETPDAIHQEAARAVLRIFKVERELRAEEAEEL